MKTLLSYNTICGPPLHMVLDQKIGCHVESKKTVENFLQCILEGKYKTKFESLHNITVALMLLPGACQNSSCLQAFNKAHFVISAAYKPA